MAVFARKRVFDRSRILAEAARARSKKRRRKAIALYRWLLAVEPRNAELHGKLAPLLAETGQYFDAWMSFRATAQAQLRAGQTDKALAVYREASLYLPCEVQVWQAIARLQQKRGSQRDALETLFEGIRQFRSGWQRPQAIYLLRCAREIDPWDFETVLDLARLLATSDQAAEARLLLEGLAARSQGTRLRRVRAAQLRIHPGLRQAWRWLRAFGGAPASRPRTQTSAVVRLASHRGRPRASLDF